ncbi:MAG TPA: hypothetical protein VIL97_08640 [Thermoanaerobaculia bacterium]
MNRGIWIARALALILLLLFAVLMLNLHSKLQKMSSQSKPDAKSARP